MSIFVSLASYRDSDCHNTLENLYATAKDPSFVYVGVCQQNKPGVGEEQCVASTAGSRVPERNVRRINLHHKEAQGPCWARYLCSTMYEDEEYYLQIDSHMRFVQDWDAKLIAMIAKVESETGSNRIVLSTYVRVIEDYNEETKQGADDNIPRICQAFWDHNGMISLHGASILPPSTIAKQVPFVAGGLMFVRAKPFLSEVPYDPELRDIFTGEEILHSARIWTAGWDIFTPTENIAYHHFIREGMPKFWDDNVRDDSASMKRVRYLLKFSKERPDAANRGLDRYGMGSVRSLKDYYAFAGIDPVNLTVNKNFCDAPLLPTSLSSLPARKQRSKRIELLLMTSCLGVLLAAMVWVLVSILRR